MCFDKSVFINCPFDEAYLELLCPLIYTVKKLGFKVRIASERSDSGEVRLAKIKELIESCRYGIHDLSRSKSSQVNEYFRLNMAFELGLDLGCRDYKSGQKFRTKQILILEEERYSVQKALSDLSFADCKCHKGEPEEIVYEVRNWFVENGLKNGSSASSLWDSYNIFYSNLYENRAGFSRKDIDRLPIREFMDEIDRLS